MSYVPTSWSEASDIASDIKKDVAITRTSVEGFVNKIRAQATNLGNLAQPAPVGWARMGFLCGRTSSSKS